MATFIKIFFGILIGVGVVAFWPIIVSVVYVVGVTVVTVLVAGGQFLIYIGFAIMVVWLSYKLAQYVWNSINN